MPLFFSHFFTSICFVVRKYCGCDHAVDHLVNGVKKPLLVFPLLYHDYWPVSKFQGDSTKVLLRKNMFLSFKDMECKENCMPSLSGQTRSTQNAKHLNKGGRIYHDYLILYYILHYTELSCHLLASWLHSVCNFGLLIT
jgi:hypothetical protein